MVWPLPSLQPFFRRGATSAKASLLLERLTLETSLDVFSRQSWM